MTAVQAAIDSVPIIDLGKEYRLLKNEIDARLEQILSSGSYILGRESARFESEIAAYCGTSHAVGVNSGTDAILIALRSLGIGPGDEVVLPAMSFIATAEPIVMLGARPVFADIDPVTLGLDAKQLQQRITPKTKAIIVVHLYGQTPDMTQIVEIARAAGIPLVEDMAQAIGAEWQGKKAGSFGAIACLSFFPTKNLGACGDAGALLTSSDAYAERARLYRNHGAPVKYQHEEIGYNSRLDEIQAAILSIKLTHLDAWNSRRRQLAQRYTDDLKAVPGLECPQEAAGAKHIFHLYSVQCEHRDALREFLNARQIASGLHYPAPLHLQKALAFLGHRPGDYPVSERLARQTLSLPLFPQMTEAQADRVIGAVKTFFGTPRAA